MLKFVYTVFIALLIAAFVGLGIDAFYPAPKYPDYPTELKYAEPVMKDEDQLTQEEKSLRRMQQDEYEKKSKQFEEDNKLYNRNVSMIALGIAIAILAFSLMFANQLKLIADGVILGGVFTLIYGIVRGFNAGDPMFRFGVVTVGLVVSLIVGYLKFLKPNNSK